MASAVKEENGAESLLACRICLATDAKLFNIREWGLDQVFVDIMGTTVSYLNYILDLTGEFAHIIQLELAVWLIGYQVDNRGCNNKQALLS